MHTAETIIRALPHQLRSKITIQNEKNLPDFNDVLVGGMGGSQLSARLLRIPVCSQYLPPQPVDPSGSTLYIASSYSGTTEETLSFARNVLENNGALAAITTGGELLELAVKNHLPHVILPTDAWQPRFSTGYGLRALGTLAGMYLSDDFITCADKLEQQMEDHARNARRIAEFFENAQPLIYSWGHDESAYVFKIAYNENTKIPAFLNVFPELNHNELAGFEWNDKSRHLTEKIRVLVLRTPEPNFEKGLKRIEATKAVLMDKGIPVMELTLEGTSRLGIACSTLACAHLSSIYLAEFYGADPGNIEIVEKFKKQL